MPITFFKLALAAVTAAAVAIGITSPSRSPAPKPAPSSTPRLTESTVAGLERTGARLIDRLASGHLQIDAAEIAAWRSATTGPRSSALPRLRAQLGREVGVGNLTAAEAADLLTAASAELPAR